MEVAQLPTYLPTYLHKSSSTKTKNQIGTMGRYVGSKMIGRHYVMKNIPTW